MTLRQKPVAERAEALTDTVQQKRANWQHYQDQHGALSLSTYVFLTEPKKGFPVLVKSHDEAAVTLVILQTGTQFSVRLDDYNAHRGSDFLLDPTLEDLNKTEFDKQAGWFRRAYRSLELRFDVHVPNEVES